MWKVTGRYYGFSKRCATALLLTSMAFAVMEGNPQALASHGQLKETRKLAPEDRTPGDEYGRAVAFSGDFALVGAARGLVNDVDCGTAYIFSRNHGDPNPWGQVVKLVAADGAAGDKFGCSVALSHDLALVGAHADDDHGRSSGSAYLFGRDRGGAGKWGQIAKLTAADGRKRDRFGYFVGLSGDLAIVGAPAATLDKTVCGAAYIFSRNQGGPNRWGQVAKLVPSNPLPLAAFGGCVALSGDLALVGEDQDIGALAGVQGGSALKLPDDISRARVSQAEMAARSGAAYLFARNQGGPDRWGQVAKLTPKDLAPNSLFGAYVALSDELAVVTATSDHGREPRSRCGSAYVFGRDQGGRNQWGQVAKLTASDASRDNDCFGASVSLSGDMVLIGAMVPGDVWQGTGAAYLFKRNHGGPDKWGQAAKLTASDGTLADLFGRSVALSGQAAFVGAHYEIDFHHGKRLGSAYLFDLNQKALAEDGQLKETRKLAARNQASEDHFGSVVALSGDLALVGAPGDLVKDSRCGSAYVFSRNHGGPNQWGQVARLVADDPAVDDCFGCSVALSHDLALVGAHADEDHGRSSGSAYLFARDCGHTDKWRQIAKLTAEDGHEGDHFGHCVQLSGDLAIVGAPTNYKDETRRGAAYVFARNHGGPNRWGQVANLVPSDPRFLSGFGSAVALSDNLALVGASETRLDDQSGAAYLFARNQGGPDHWGQVAKLTAKDLTPGSCFGSCVDLSGDLAIVTAPCDDAKGGYSGAAYVFARNQGGRNRWGQVAKLTATDGGVKDLFGFSVCLSGDMALVGAVENFPWGSECGGAYVFRRNQGGADKWGEVAKLIASDGARRDLFGRSVALSGNTALVGAHCQTDSDNNKRLGSAYLFRIKQLLSFPKTSSEGDGLH